MSHLNLHMCGSRRGDGVLTPPPLKNNKSIGFDSNIGPDPCKAHNYQDSFQCWANIGTPAKRHLNQMKKKIKLKKRYQSWTSSDKTFWIRAWNMCAQISTGAFVYYMLCVRKQRMLWRDLTYEPSLLAYATSTKIKYFHHPGACADPEGGGDRGSGPPLKNHKIIGFPSNTGPDLLKHHKSTKPAFNVLPSSACQRNAI